MKTHLIMGLALTAILFSSMADAKNKRKRMPYSQAKQECLQEDPNLTGQALQKCIKGKRR